MACQSTPRFAPSLGLLAMSGSSGADITPDALVRDKVARHLGGDDCTRRCSKEEEALLLLIVQACLEWRSRAPRPLVEQAALPDLRPEQPVGCFSFHVVCDCRVQ